MPTGIEEAVLGWVVARAGKTAANAGWALLGHLVAGSPARRAFAATLGRAVTETADEATPVGHDPDMLREV